MTVISNRSWVWFGLFGAVSWLGCSAGDGSRDSSEFNEVAGSTTFGVAASGSVFASAGSAAIGFGGSTSSSVGESTGDAGADGLLCGACSPLDCGAGMMNAEVPSCACPYYCVPDPSCFRASDLYQAIHDTIIAQPENSACNADSDCVAIQETNACASCYFDVVAKSRVEAVQQALAAEAQEDCGHCPTEAQACSPNEAQPVCSGGTCLNFSPVPIPLK